MGGSHEASRAVSRPRGAGESAPHSKTGAVSRFLQSGNRVTGRVNSLAFYRSRFLRELSEIQKLAAYLNDNRGARTNTPVG